MRMVEPEAPGFPWAAASIRTYVSRRTHSGGGHHSSVHGRGSWWESFPPAICVLTAPNHGHQNRAYMHDANTRASPKEVRRKALPSFFGISSSFALSSCLRRRYRSANRFQPKNRSSHAIDFDRAHASSVLPRCIRHLIASLLEQHPETIGNWSLQLVERRTKLTELT